MVTSAIRGSSYMYYSQIVLIILAFSDLNIQIVQSGNENLAHNWFKFASYEFHVLFFSIYRCKLSLFSSTDSCLILVYSSNEHSQHYVQCIVHNMQY